MSMPTIPRETVKKNRFVRGRAFVSLKVGKTSVQKVHSPSGLGSADARGRGFCRVLKRTQVVEGHFHRIEISLYEKKLKGMEGTKFRL